MASTSKGRYILHKTDDSAGPKVCAFFSTGKGCKNGASCKFLHGPASSPAPVARPAPVAPAPVARPAPVAPAPVARPAPVAPATPAPPTTTTSEKKKRKSSSNEPESDQKKLKSHHDDEDEKKQIMKTPKAEKQKGSQSVSTTTTPHSFVKSLPVTPFHPAGYHPTDDDEDESSFLYFAVNHALSQAPQTPDVAPTKKRKSSSSAAPAPAPPPAPLVAAPTTFVPTTSNPQQISSYSNFFLPVAEVEKINEMNISSEKALQERKKAKKSPGKFLIEPQQSQCDGPAISFVPQQQKPLQQKTSAAAAPFIPLAPGLPLPTSQFATPPPPAQAPASTSTAPTVHVPVDPRVSDWSDLVQQCANHSRYAKDYTFSTDSEWIQAKPYGEWAKSCPAIIAIDCEMCETVDPVTDAKNSSALVRVSIVDGIIPSEILLDSLVAPNWPISEMRTRIHGIAESNLTGVTFTLRHAQAFLMKICSDQTIIVGHALHHDLRALKLQHKCVIDTSYLYTIENEPNSLLSLRDIAKHLYDQKLSIHHDSVQDAQVSLMLAVHVKVNGTPAPIPRSSSHNSNIDETMLFIHRLPLGMSEEVIREMMMVMTNVMPTIVNPVSHSTTTQTTPTGKTNAVFSSAAHANLCFDTLPGLDRPDKGGRSQKRVYLKGGGYICVRKA